MSFRTPLPVLAAALLAGCAGARGGKAPPAEDRRAFDVPGHGALEVSVPPGWTAEATAGEPPAPVTVRLAGPGDGFVALLTPFWNTSEPEDEPAHADTAQLLAELARRSALPGAAEREIPLEEVVGDGVHGFWFAATDRALVGKEPGPGEWRHLVQGAAAVGPLIVAFTLLDNGPGPQRSRLLEVVRGARHVAGGRTAEPRPAMEFDPDVSTVPLRVLVAGKSWTVLVDLPGFRMFRPRPSEDGEGTAVLGQSPQAGIVASVIVRPAGGARDAKGCREADLAKLRKAVPLVELRTATIDAAARAAYAVDDVRGKPHRQTHAHAWLFREDVCVNVHVSKIEPEPGDADRMERILDGVRFGEEL